MEAAGYVRRGHGLHHRRVVSELIGPEAFADVAVQVYLVHYEPLPYFISSQVTSYSLPSIVRRRRVDARPPDVCAARGRET